jgi:PLP dependent protein
MNFESLSKYCLEKNVILVAVSKTQSIEAIKALYDKGQRIFGENKVQEILDKKDLLPSDIQWHLIGHLQTNKVRQILPFVAMIHSVDSEKLAVELQKEAARIHKKIPVLLQMKIAEEETKFGMSEDELSLLVSKSNAGEFENLSIEGLMGMASFVDDENQVKQEFNKLKSYFDETKNQISNKDAFQHLSMGMSGDYELAIAAGANMVRIGSLLFGSRS